MAILYTDEIRDMTAAAVRSNLRSSRETELLNSKAQRAAGGGMPESPGRVKEMKKTIARIKTIQAEEGDFDE